MADTNNTERAAFEAWFTQGVPDQRSVEIRADGEYRFMHAAQAWSAWQARAALAPSAGDEPVATVYTMEALVPGGGVKYHAQMHAELPAGTKLFTRPQPPEAREGWRDISTAPKDGTDILITNGKDVTVGHWLHEEPYIREHRDLEGRYAGQDESDGHDDWIDWAGGIPNPTHWMPLPPPPSGASKE